MVLSLLRRIFFTRQFNLSFFDALQRIFALLFIVDVDIGQTLPCFREGPEDGLVVGIWSSCRVARASWQNSRRLFFATRSLLPQGCPGRRCCCAGSHVPAWRGFPFPGRRARPWLPNSRGPAGRG